MRTDFRLGFYKSYTIAFSLDFFFMTATNHFLCSYLLLPFLLSFCFYLSWCLCLLSVTTKDTRYYKLIYSMFHAIAKRKAKYPYSVPRTGRTQKLWNVWNCVGLIMVKKQKKSQRGCSMGSCMSLPVTKIGEERQRSRPTHDQIKAMLSLGQWKGKKGVFYQEMMAIKEKDMDERV